MGLSAMMQQYLRIKEQNQDALLFFRLGDFYELFYEDAILASELLDLTLTGKRCGLEERAPMCGVPFHAVDSYIAKLLEKGYKAAICEQCDENEGDNTKLMKRDVVRIITPGTIVESNMLSEDKNNYLASVYYGDDEIGVSWSDISTGELNHAVISESLSIKLNDLLMRIEPAEIICNEKMMRESIELSAVKYNGICAFTTFSEQSYDYDNAYECISTQLSSESMKGLGNKRACICSAGALISYVISTQKRAIPHIKNSNDQDRNQYMVIDSTARKTLELIKSSELKRTGSLLWLLDKTSTSMGSRLLRQWIERPSNDIDIINNRLDGVEELLANVIIRDKIQKALSDIFDLERLVSRLSIGTINPRECLSLSLSLSQIPIIKQSLQNLKSNIFTSMNNKIIAQDDIAKLISDAISENATTSLRDSGIIREGYDDELDMLRHAKENAMGIIADIEAAERQSTGIKTLKVGYNRVFGYYIEVSKSQIDSVPYRYIRKQTIANGERYITDELKEIEGMVLNSVENAVIREQELFSEVVERIKEDINAILSTARQLAELDCLISNSIIANKNHYSKPTMVNNSGICKIVEGRHPIVECINKSEMFVPNDTILNDTDSKIMLITGPNMAGKSIYMKQVALITIMAHIGSYVPAKSAQIAIVDRIFTRVGASDDLSTGRSTFMVEMSEVSNIISNATDNSLILLDEVGRGTSTYDGLSIAWSIMDYLSKNLKSKVLFSTHYYELTELEGVLEGVKNYKLMVKELQGTVVFLRKLMRGSANRSFGIEVAGLAGIPEQIVHKAKDLLVKLEAADIGRQAKMAGNHQISMFNSNISNEVVSIIKDVDTDNLTPRQAMDILIDLKDKVVKCQ